ncbi:MutS-related protein [Endozoicomonas numazuensis]|uniref:MutS-related protein n=1 Tax=Endozoicomonas numazuensis TaxID=1137799 RepID=UPI001F28C4BA|nr:hypothetical protein [Endozoicomonas numazuensis]
MFCRLVCALYLLPVLARAEIIPAVKEVGDIYLKSFNKDMEEDAPDLVDPANERFVSLINDPSGLAEQKAINKTEYQKREVLVRLLAAQISKIPKPVKLSPRIWEDNRVVGDERSERPSLLDNLFPSKTLAGEIYRALILAQPTSDHKVLQHQQTLVKEASQAAPTRKKALATLEELRPHEPEITSFFDPSDIIYSTAMQESLASYGYRSVLQKIYDGSAYALSWTLYIALKTWFGISTANVITAPFLLPRYLSCSFVLSITYVGFYISSAIALETFEYTLRQLNQKRNMTIYKALRVRLDALSQYLRIAMRLNDETELPEALRLDLTSYEKEAIDAFLYDSEWLIYKDPTASRYYITKAAETLRQSIELKKTIAKVLYQTAKMDLYLSISERMDSDAENQPGITFTEFSDQPAFIRALDLWNPAVDPDNAVTNNVLLGTKGSAPSPICYWSPTPTTCNAESEVAPNGLILSGSNASGKSTLMRALTINVLFLSQVVGIATAKSFETSFFHAAHSYMDKSDKTGDYSSYKGELQQALAVLKQAESMGNKKNMLACFDELLSSTNPRDGLKVIKKVLRALSRQLTTLSIISSHYDLKSLLTPEARDFALKHMHVKKTNGTLIRTFQLRDGQNEENSALYQLMEEFQFIPEIYEEIRNIAVAEGEIDE